VTHAVVHHTAGANKVADWDNELRNIWFLHTYTNTWGDIGYNFLIDAAGHVYQGRRVGRGSSARTSPAATPTPSASRSSARSRVSRRQMPRSPA
jgi:hypothetical protein